MTISSGANGEDINKNGLEESKFLLKVDFPIILHPLLVRK
jgi:hypothetical protein